MDLIIIDFILFQESLCPKMNWSGELRYKTYFTLIILKFNNQLFLKRRRERKIHRQLQKQRKRLAARGIFKDLQSLRDQWHEGQNPELNEIELSNDEDEDDEIDVENDEDERVSSSSGLNLIPSNAISEEKRPCDKFKNENSTYRNSVGKKPSFSIDNLLSHALQKNSQSNN